MNAENPKQNKTSLPNSSDLISSSSSQHQQQPSTSSAAAAAASAVTEPEKCQQQNDSKQFITFDSIYKLNKSQKYLSNVERLFILGKNYPKPIGK